MGLFVANLALLPLAMTSMASTIQLLQQMGILPEVGTCSTCSFSTGAYTYYTPTILFGLLLLGWWRTTVLKEATKRQEKTDTEIVFDEEDPDEEEDVDEDEEVDVDDFDLELFHFFDCIGCKAIFQEKKDLLLRAANCDSL